MGNVAPRPGPSAGARIWIRLIVSPVILAIVLGVLWAHDATGRSLPSDILLLLLGAGGSLELTRLFRESGRDVPAWPGVVFSGLLAGVGLFAPESAALRMEIRVILVTLAVLAVLLQYLRSTRPEAVERIALAWVPVLFVGLLLSWTRELAIDPRPARLLVWVVLTAKASDMGGWLVGKPFGRHKLIPSVSPGKSWEGLAGGLAGSVLFAILLPPLLDLPQQSWSVVRLGLFGVVTGLASVLAGVLWSGWKRRLGAKDSSPLIPEVGGVLDMVDSMLVAGPVAWAWLRLGL